MKATPRRHRGRAPLLLLALCAGLGLIIYLELDRPAIDPAWSAPTPRPASPAGESDPGFRLPPLAAYSEVVARPLFSPSRRPGAAAESGPEDGGQASPFTIMGTVVSDTARRALISHGNPPQLAHVTEGQRLEGWTVETIAADRVVLTQGGQRVEIKVKDRSDGTAQQVLRGVPGGALVGGRAALPGPGPTGGLPSALPGAPPKRRP
jgi:general secretion pathway protein N